MRFVSFAKICVYLDISKDLPTSIKLSWQDEEWEQEIDYEHIPFRCKHYHEYGQMYREFPQILWQPMHAHSGREKDTKGFEKVGFCKRTTKKPTPPKT
jgi:hypothetical protein